MELKAIFIRGTLCSRSRPICYSQVWCPCMCLSQTHKSAVLLKRQNGSSWFLAQRLPSAYSTLCWNGIRVSSKILDFSLELCRKIWTSPIFRPLPFCQSTSIVASIYYTVNLVRPTTVACSSHWTSVFVYNTVRGTQLIARARLRVRPFIS